MCNPAAIAIGGAGTQIAGGLLSARATNKASEANAEAMVKQAKAQMGAQLIERITNLQDTARETFGRKKATQEALGTVRANFSDILGTPGTDAERLVKNDAMDAEWALAKTMDVTHLNTKEAVQRIALGTASRIASLPTVGITEQIMGVAEAGIGGSSTYIGLKNMEANTSLANKKLG